MFGDIRYARVCYKQGGIKGLNTVASGRGQGNYRGVRFPMPVRVRVRDGIGHWAHNMYSLYLLVVYSTLYIASGLAVISYSGKVLYLCKDLGYSKHVLCYSKLYLYSN